MKMKYILFFIILIFLSCDNKTTQSQSLPQCTITGLVKDFETNQPIFNVEIIIADSSAFTDDTGYYTISNVLQGQQAIKAKNPMYDNYSSTILLESVNMEYNFTMTVKYPTVSGVSVNYTDKGNPAPMTNGNGEITSEYVKNFELTAACTANDAKGIDRVFLQYTAAPYVLRGGGTPPYTFDVPNVDEINSLQDELESNFSNSGGNQYQLTRTQNINLYELIAYASMDVIWINHSINPKIVVVDTDGNIVEYEASW